MSLCCCSSLLCLQQVWLISSANVQEQEAGDTFMGVDEQPEGGAEGDADPLLRAAFLLDASDSSASCQSSCCKGSTVLGAALCQSDGEKGDHDVQKPVVTSSHDSTSAASLQSDTTDSDLQSADQPHTRVLQPPPAESNSEVSTPSVTLKGCSAEQASVHESQQQLRHEQPAHVH